MNLADIILHIVIFLIALTATSTIAYIFYEVDHRFHLVGANILGYLIFGFGLLAGFILIYFLLTQTPQPRKWAYRTFPTATTTPTPTGTPTPTRIPKVTEFPNRQDQSPFFLRGSNLSKSLYAIIKPIWELVLFIPLPWRVGIVLGVVAWLLLRALPNILYRSTHFLTSFVGKNKDKQIRVSNKFFGLQRRWILSIAAIPIILWYVYPSLSEITVGSYIDDAFVEWDKFEGWAISGEWQPLSQIIPTVTSTPKPRRQTSTPSIAPVPTRARKTTPTTVSCTKFPATVPQIDFKIKFIIEDIEIGDKIIKFNISIKRIVSNPLQWYSDKGNEEVIFLRQSNGKKYPANSVGGIFAKDSQLQKGEIYKGSISFNKPDDTQFTFNYPKMHSILIKLCNQ